LRTLTHQNNAHALIQEVVVRLQEQLKYRVCELTTLALHSIHGPHYTFDLELELKRGGTEATPTLIDAHGNKLNPKEDNGGGIVETIAFAMRCSLLLLQKQGYVPLIILDEPFARISTDLQEKVAGLLNLISKDLGMQFIIITQEPELAELVECGYHVKKRKRNSYVAKI